MRLELKLDESISKGVMRLLHKRIDTVLDMLDDAPGALTDDEIHDMRKLCKEARGILRLVRSELGEKTFRRENRVFRNVARPLSKVRDSKVLSQRLDSLLEHFAGRIEARDLAQVRQKLSARRAVVRRDVFQKRRTIARMRRKLRAASKRVDDWRLRDRGWKTV